MNVFYKYHISIWRESLKGMFYNVNNNSAVKLTSRKFEFIFIIIVPNLRVTIKTNIFFFHFHIEVTS